MSAQHRPSEPADLEARLRAWIDLDSTSREPAALYGSVMSATSSTKPRPGFLVARRNRARLDVTEPRSALRIVAVAAILTLMLAIAVGVGLIIGSQTRQMDDPGPATGAFVPTDDLPEALGWLLRPGVAQLQDGRVLIAGGGQEAPFAVVYDPMSGTYGEPLDMPAMHQGATATTLEDGRVLITGGDDGMTGALLDAASLFDPETEAVVATGPMATPRDFHTATRLDDGRVLIVGGYTAIGDEENGFRYEPVVSAELYDPTTGSFSQTGSMTTARASHSATNLPDGRVVIIGGYSSIDNDSGATTLAPSAEVYDPATGTFEVVGSLVTPRSGHAAVLLDDGRVLVIGGGRASPRPFPQEVPFLASAEWFDPATETFTATAGSLVTERAYPSVALLADGNVLVVGGNNGFGVPHSAELFDRDSGSFLPAGTTAGAHDIGQAVRLDDGRVFLPGAGQAPEGLSELFVPGTIADEPQPLPEATTGTTLALRRVDSMALRTEHTATLLEDGRVLIAGGYGGETNQYLAEAQLFDPTTDRSGPTGPMAAPRGEHLAVLLSDGRVLIVDPWEGSADRTEVFDPTTERFAGADPALRAQLEGWQVVPVAGLSRGRLVLANGDRQEMTILDLDTGRRSSVAPACYFRGGAVELADGRILEGCGADTGAMIYDPATGTSSKAQGIEGELWPLYRLRDGRVLGATRQGGEVDAVRFTASLVYDPLSGELTTVVPDDATSPMAGTIVELDDGRLLMVGGNEGNVSSAIRVLDPVTWEYRDVGELLAPRSDAPAIQLDDGRVLVVGGARRSPDRGDPVPAGAEIFDPAELPDG